jgi:hypothetical protein
MDIRQLVSYCGLTCQSCPIYWATQEPDKTVQKKMRGKIAQLANERYQITMTPDDISDCDGCRAESGRLFSGCSQCEIRKCAIQQNYITCAECPDYICEKLDKHYQMDPSGKIWLEIIKSLY